MPVTINGTTTSVIPDASGNVGIGTSTPIYTAANRTTLSVNGTSTAVVSIGHGNSTSQAGYFYWDGTNFQTAAGGTTANLTFVTNSTERMKIDNGGRVTTPSQPRFSGFRTDAAPNWFGSSTVAIFAANNAYVNTGNCYNTTTGVFTCPVAGNYRIAFAALVGNIGWAMLYFQKNGVTSSSLCHGNPNGASLWFTIGYEVIVSCAANDTLAAAFNTSGAGYVYNSGYNYVTIELVG